MGTHNKLLKINVVQAVRRGLAAFLVASVSLAALQGCGGGTTTEGPQASATADAVPAQRDTPRAVLEVRDGTMPVGLKDHAYDATIDIAGGTAPYTYSVSAGELPPGIELDPATGKLSGIAAKSGTYSFTI